MGIGTKNAFKSGDERDAAVLLAKKMVAPSLPSKESMDTFRKLPLDAAASVCGCAERILREGHPQREGVAVEYTEAIREARDVIAGKLMAEPKIWYMVDLATGRAFIDDDGSAWLFTSGKRARACANQCAEQYGRPTLKAVCTPMDMDSINAIAFLTYVCGARAFTLDVDGDSLEFDPEALGAASSPWGGPLANPPIVNPDLMRCLARLRQDAAVDGKDAARVAKSRKDALMQDAAEAFAHARLLVPAREDGKNFKVSIVVADGERLLAAFTDDFVFRDACRGSQWTDAMMMDGLELAASTFKFNGIIVNPGSMDFVCKGKVFRKLTAKIRQCAVAKAEA